MDGDLARSSILVPSALPVFLKIGATSFPAAAARPSCRARGDTRPDGSWATSFRGDVASPADRRRAELNVDAGDGTPMPLSGGRLPGGVANDASLPLRLLFMLWLWLWLWLWTWLIELSCDSRAEPLRAERAEASSFRPVPRDSSALVRSPWDVTDMDSLLAGSNAARLADPLPGPLLGRLLLLLLPWLRLKSRLGTI